MPPTGKSLLIVFTRNPVKGNVKTRLARSTSDEFALKVYCKLREITFGAVSAVKADVAVYYDDHIPSNDLFCERSAQTFLQNGSDLGIRMKNAFERGFSDSYSRIVLIGTDCPGMNSRLLQKAFEILHYRQAVLGPASDGGYYLVGLTLPLPDLFTNREWSTSRVLQEAKECLEENGVSYGLLPILTDIDTGEDLQNVNLAIS